MAVYGVNIYGTGRFGIDPNLARPDFSIAPFASTPLDYLTLQLSWHKPQSTDCTVLQLVRNGRNLAQDESDGMVIFTQPVGQAASYTDGNAVAPGFNYYTMWGWDNRHGVWVRCGDLIALLPIKWGYGEHFYSLLPAAYRDQDSVLVDPYNPWAVNGSDNQPPLQRYLALIGFEMDFIRTELESLTSVNDALNCSGALLPLLAFQFGLPNEPTIGMQQERQLVNNAIHLYKLKGSPRGITEFSSLMTSYPVAQIVHHGYNLMLTRDDSVMDSSIGTWQPWPPPPSEVGVARFPQPSGTNVGLSLTQIPNLLLYMNQNPTEIIGFEPPLSGSPPPYNNTGMRAQVTTASHIDITTDPMPVLDFLSHIDGPGTVTFQIQVWSAVARSVELSVWADAGNGTPILLAPVASPLPASTTGDWKQFTYTAQVNPYTTTYAYDSNGVPIPTITAAYYWLYPRLRVLNAGANEAHYITLGMVWPCPPSKIGLDTPVYDYPRDLKVILAPQATNLLSNPLTSFNVGGPYGNLIGFDGWSAALDPIHPKTSAQSAPIYIHYATPDDPPGAYAVNGIGSLEVLPTNTQAVVWTGLVQPFTVYTPPLTLPAGWFSDPHNDWFGGATLGPGPQRPWMDPVLSWFFINDGYFSLGTEMVGGNWFSQAQPPLTNNLVGFTAIPGQPLNFSIYARYMNTPDPSMVAMQMGLRWYFPDGTWYEDSDTFPLTQDFARYQFPPDNSSRGETPVQASTGLPATTVFPFVRFPMATLGTSFLLNSAMLAPSATMPAYMDFSMYAGNPDYTQTPSGSTLYYRGLNARSARLGAELYRFVPMGSSYTVSFGTANTSPPLDPTLW